VTDLNCGRERVHDSGWNAYLTGNKFRIRSAFEWCLRDVPFRQLKPSLARSLRKSLCNLIPRIDGFLQRELRFDSLLDLVKCETEFPRRAT